MPAIKRLLFLVLIILPLRMSEAQQTTSKLEFSVAVLGDLEGLEQDTWIFEGKAGQVVNVSAEVFPPDPDTLIDPLIEIYDASGNLIATDDDSGGRKDALLIGVKLPVDGDYTVIVKNITEWYGGSYAVTLVENPLPENCETPMGTMITGQISSTIGKTDFPYRVYLPPCHEVMQQRYPYALLMHGSNAADSHWDNLGLDESIARGVALNRLPPMALVLPFGKELANTNVFREDYSWEYVVINELVPHVESTYCLLNDREHKAIGGISRGGFWAFLIAFRHPEIFGTLGGHSPFFDLYHAPASHNPLDLALAPPPLQPLRIWMDRGRNDYAQENIDLIHERLTSNNIEHTYMLYDVGQHENDYWAAHRDDYLYFYAANWDTELPECI